MCSSCVLGYTFTNGACSPKTICDGACTACPAGYGLVNGECKTCTGTNCRSCLSTSLSTCTSCISGFYFDSKNSACNTCSI